MTIEEKAIRYDEVKNKLSRFIAQGVDPLITRADVQDFFPELAESKDEKVRKGIFKALSKKDARDVLISQGIEVSDALAWLEKQGEPIDKIVKRAMNEKQRVLLTETNGDANIDWDTRSLQDVKLLLEYGLDYIKKLEKQGEQEEPQVYETEDGEVITYSESEGYKVIEPKFHEGDFIKHNKANIICKVISVNSGSYYVENIETNGRIELFNARQNFHLWTIQDAKDGDVLAVNGKPFICYHTDEYRSNYCCIDDKGSFRTNIRFSFEGNCILPATKEQRDLLFQKMKEVGYEWDAETKELRRIEHNVQLTEFEEAVKDLMNDYRDAIGDNDATIEEIKKHATYLLSLIRQKPAWSEEDEHRLKDAIYFLDTAKKHYASTEELDACIDWLKSFKGRVQPKQEWNEEDSIRLQRIIDFLWYNRKGDTDTIYQQEQDIDWLKSLRPQNRWKPSDEQIKAIRLARSFVVDDFGEHPMLSETLMELEEQLKKLREE